MKVKELSKLLKNVSPEAEVLIFPDGVEDEDGDMILPGVGYYDPDTQEFVYIGDASTVETTDED